MKILFVCTGNTCRSPMAAGYFRHLCEKSGAGGILIESAGAFAETGICASEQSVNIIKKYGIDISGHRSSSLTPEKIDSADLIVTMTAAQKRHIGSINPEALKKTKVLLEFAEKEKDIFDPLGGTEEIYGGCFREMKVALDNLFLEVWKKSER